ncbi:hypothetical protein Q604_UNBC00186G0001, partial [human gut metagenome]
MTTHRPLMMSRRTLLTAAGVTALGATLAACGAGSSS